MEPLRLEYVHRHLLDGIRDIFSAQKDIATRRIYREGRNRTVRQGSGRTVLGSSGYLVRALSSPAVEAWKGALGSHATLDYPLYIRFLDMREHGNYKIYNRQIWGILYNDTWNRIRFGFTHEVREKLRAEIMAAMSPPSK
ncbi:MAG: hypothetical protein K2H87_04980 [Duncaniella sp.]|nr:hypothetical protein [Duncaniella sp.]